MAAINQDIDARQTGAPAHIGMDQFGPRVDLAFAYGRITIAGQIDKPHQFIGRRRAQRKEVQLLGAPGRIGHTRQMIAIGQRIEQRGFADIGSAGKGDFGRAQFGQAVNVICCPNEFTRAGKKLSPDFDLIDRLVRLGHSLSQLVSRTYCANCPTAQS